jgi:hypothetical protein
MRGFSVCADAVVIPFCAGSAVEDGNVGTRSRTARRRRASPCGCAGERVDLDAGGGEFHESTPSMCRLARTARCSPRRVLGSSRLASSSVSIRLMRW